MLSEIMVSGAYWKITKYGGTTGADTGASTDVPEHKHITQAKYIPLPPPYVGFYVNIDVWTDDFEVEVIHVTGIKVGGVKIKKLPGNAKELKFEEGNKVYKLVFVRVGNSKQARGELRVAGSVIGTFSNRTIVSW